MSSSITGMQRLYRSLQAFLMIWDHFMSSMTTGMQRLHRFLQGSVTILDHVMSFGIAEFEIACLTKPKYVILYCNFYGCFTPPQKN